MPGHMYSQCEFHRFTSENRQKKEVETTSSSLRNAGMNLSTRDSNVSIAQAAQCLLYPGTTSWVNIQLPLLI